MSDTTRYIVVPPKYILDITQNKIQRNKIDVVNYSYQNAVRIVESVSTPSISCLERNDIQSGDTTIRNYDTKIGDNISFTETDGERVYSFYCENFNGLYSYTYYVNGKTTERARGYFRISTSNKIVNKGEVVDIKEKNSYLETDYSDTVTNYSTAAVDENKRIILFDDYSKFLSAMSAKVNTLTLNPDVSYFGVVFVNDNELQICFDLRLSYYVDRTKLHIGVTDIETSPRTLALTMVEKSIGIGNANFTLDNNELTQRETVVRVDNLITSQGATTEIIYVTIGKAQNFDIWAFVSIEHNGLFQFRRILIPAGETQGTIVNNLKVGDDIWGADVTVETEYAYCISETYLANAIKRDFSKGKETVILKCCLGEYYYDNGALAKSIKKAMNMTFNVGDIVCPYIVSASGINPITQQEKPLSYYSGTQIPKLYRITEVEIENDGVIQQNLRLQEIGI